MRGLRQRAAGRGVSWHRSAASVWGAGTWTTWASAALLVIAAPAAAQIAVSNGSAGYSHAIRVPPGGAGLQPEIALSYTGGNMTPVGKGWSIQGIPTITRCAATKALDGQISRINFDPSDKLCLDGLRLIQTSAVGVPLPFPQVDDAKALATGQTREFRTEGDAYARIRAYGAIDGNLNGPPQYFKVWTKDGRVLEFGPSPASASPVAAQIARAGVAGAWVLVRQTDRSGNRIDYEYITHASVEQCAPLSGSPGLDWGVSRINYGANTPAGTPVRSSVRFQYAPLACDGDQAEIFYNGLKRSIVARLDRVRTYEGETPVQVTKLEYSRPTLSRRSLLRSISTCTGDETRCTPATEFTYTAGGIEFTSDTNFTRNAAGQSNGLEREYLKRPWRSAETQAVGTIEGDFNGDGRTDLLIWNDNPSNNKLFLSEGVGNFRRVPNGNSPGQFNITTEHLFISVQRVNLNGWSPGVYVEERPGYDTCYRTMVADVNGDGMSDLIRIFGLGMCNAPYNWGAPYSPRGTYVFLSRGDGSFERQEIRNAATQAGIPLAGFFGSPGRFFSESGTRNWYQRNLYGDFDRDGKLDILSIAGNSAYHTNNGNASFMMCERNDYPTSCGISLWRGRGDGSFDLSPVTWSKVPNPNLNSGPSVAPGVPTDSFQLYQPSEGRWVTYRYFVPYGFTPEGIDLLRVSDVDGDGVLDLRVENLLYLGNGAGDFRLMGESPYYVHQNWLAGDFNGDGRLDYLGLDRQNGGNGVLFGGKGNMWMAVGTFSDRDNSLTGANCAYLPNCLAFDVDGDGRVDAVDLNANAWGMASYYRSLGNGRFVGESQYMGYSVPGLPRVSYRITDLPYFSIGTYAGSGGPEFLMCREDPTYPNSPNQLVVKADPIPPDLLKSVKTETGAVATVTYEMLTRTARYGADRGTAWAATGSQVEAAPPMPVVTKLTVDTGVGGSTNVTEFGYRGYKEDQARLDTGRAKNRTIDYRGFKGDDIGRVSLGFREVRREGVAPDGASKLTQVRQALQVYPYSGSTAIDETYLGALGSMGAAQTGQLISRSEQVYCDQTAAPGAEAAATLGTPCSSTSKIRRPYLYRSVQSGRDLDGSVLPTTSTTSSYSGGYPTLIRTETTGGGPAGPQSFVKTQAIEYWPDDIAGDNWLLGLVKKSTTTSTVPNSLGAITTSAGNAPKATATSGP